MLGGSTPNWITNLDAFSFYSDKNWFKASQGFLFLPLILSQFYSSLSSSSSSSSTFNINWASKIFINWTLSILLFLSIIIVIIICRQFLLLKTHFFFLHFHSLYMKKLLLVIPCFSQLIYQFLTFVYHELTKLNYEWS